MPSRFSGGHLYAQKKTASTDAVFLIDKLALFLHASEAIAAVNGSVGLRFERNASFCAASSTSSVEEFTRATGSVLASVAASLATLRLVLEASFSVEFLFTGGENEFVATFFAD